MHQTDIFILMLIALGAYVMPIISRRLMLPSAVAELFYGMVIGTFFLDNGSVNEPIKFLSEIGFVLLMYIAGLELDLDRLSRLHRREVLSYAGFALLLVVGAFAFTTFMGLPTFFTLVLTTCAIGLLIAVMKELNMTKTRIGQTLVILGVIGEVITLTGVTVLSLIAKSGGTKDILIHIVGIVAFITAVYFVTKLLKLFLWWNPDTMKFFMSVGNPSEIGIRANLLNLFAFASLAVFVDLEAILGAFLGGAIFAKLFAEKEDMLERLSGFGYGFLIPLFFIEVGTRFKFKDFASFDVVKGAIVLSIAIFLVRTIATIPLFATKLPKKQLVYVPFAQSFPLTLLVAVTTIGASNGFIDKQHSSMIILTAVITAVVFPWLMKILHKAVPPE